MRGSRLRKHGSAPARVKGDNMANFENLKKLADEEKVDHPSHYNRPDAMEAIDEMILIFGKEAVKNFCLCNIWKYRYRAADKNGEIDLEKSDWYMKKYKELSKEETVRASEDVPNNIQMEWDPRTRSYEFKTIQGHK